MKNNILVKEWERTKEILEENNFRVREINHMDEIHFISVYPEVNFETLLEKMTWQKYSVGISDYDEAGDLYVVFFKINEIISLLRQRAPKRNRVIEKGRSLHAIDLREIYSTPDYYRSLMNCEKRLEKMIANKPSWHHTADDEKAISFYLTLSMEIDGLVVENCDLTYISIRQAQDRDIDNYMLLQTENQEENYSSAWILTLKYYNEESVIIDNEFRLVVEEFATPITVIHRFAFQMIRDRKIVTSENFEKYIEAMADELPISQVWF